MPDYTVGDTVYKRFTTRAFATGIPGTLGGTPVVSAYEDDSATQITAGITLGVDHDSVTGLNLLTIVATGGNGFEGGKSYDLVITTGTVGGVSVVGEVVWHFTLSAEAAAVDLANATDGLGALLAACATATGFATPTNITAGTITTVTNLTNLPSIPANWLTAAGIAASALDGKGDWNTGKTGYALSTAGILAIWHQDLTAVVTAGSVGKLLKDEITSVRMATLTDWIDGGRLDAILDARASQATADAIENDTQDIQSRLPAALVNSRMDSTVDGTGMESGAVDALWAKPMTELAAVPAVTGSVLAALEWLFILARNKGTQTSTTKTLRNDADDGDIATSTISDDATTFIREEWS